MKFNKLIPELSVTNIDKSKEFYLTLGFKIMYERKEDKFAFLELEGNQLMIEEINDNWNTGKLEYPFGRGINISMTINNIDNYYQELVNKNITFFKDIMINEYDVNGKTYLDKEFLIQDADGYLLRCNN
mgnify:CR=1 FL=1